MNTRSASSIAANKLTKVQLASVPFSADEFRRGRVIAGIQKTQYGLLASCKSLSLSQDKNYNLLKASLDVLSTHIGDLKSENASLRRDIASTKERVLALETTAGNPSTQGANGIPPQLLLELSEREKCSCNIVTHDLQESSAALPPDRKVDDAELLSDIILPF